MDLFLIHFFILFVCTCTYKWYKFLNEVFIASVGKQGYHEMIKITKKKIKCKNVHINVIKFVVKMHLSNYSFGCFNALFKWFIVFNSGVSDIM